MNNILIIGNGFDLDIGLKTRYSDFATSEEWKECANEESNLYKYLETKKNIERWFDLESELYKYANRKSTRSFTYEKDKLYFGHLHQSLHKYLQKQQEGKINEGSTAATLLRAVVANASFRNIYSFNYTDLNIYAKQLGIEIKSNCHYIHGCLSENSIILGVDERPLASKYDFLRKTMSPYYRSHNLFEDLYAADEVIFFGLSFGDIDYTYFNEFFRSQSSGSLLNGKKKKITIITWDEESRSDILLQLRKMDVDIQKLYGQSNFQLIRTSCNEDKGKFEELCDRLKRQLSDSEIISRLIG
jgi:hypothetical protein